jgi:type III restriction enzyme
LIWLTELAPQAGKRGEKFGLGQRTGELRTVADGPQAGHGRGKNYGHGHGHRLAAINAVRYKGSEKFTRGFLIVTPGITIKDHLRVLQPNDPDSYYLSRELVPTELLADLGKAKIASTCYHAFKLRGTLEVSQGSQVNPQGSRGRPSGDRD